jgi:phage head maturation protease
LREDSRGLFARGRLNLAVARAREVAALLEQGAIDGLSIGFKTVRARRDRRAGIRRLAEIDLWEISVVTFPMLPEARVMAPSAPRSARCRPRPSEARGRGPRLSGTQTRDDAASLGPLPSRLRREPGTTPKHS